MNENDLRVQRTRRLLREALIELMTNRDYDDLSIRDITDLAQVGYRTFFRHYESKDALLQAIVADLIADFEPRRLAPSVDQSAEKNTLAGIKYVQEHADLCRLLLQTSTADMLTAAVRAFAYGEGEMFFGGSDIPDEIVAHHFASSMTSLLRWWLENDLPCSAEEMADYMNRLVIRPIENLASDG